MTGRVMEVGIEFGLRLKLGKATSMPIRSFLVFVFVIISSLHTANSEELQYISVTSVKLYELCSNEDRDMYIMCPVYIRGWVQGAFDQHFYTVFQCVLSKNNCKKATILNCIEYEDTSAIELGRNYVAFYQDKLEGLSLSEAVEYGNSQAGRALTEMAKKYYMGCN